MLKVNTDGSIVGWDCLSYELFEKSRFKINGNTSNDELSLIATIIGDEIYECLVQCRDDLEENSIDEGDQDFLEELKNMS